mmetsp:Transcript_2041/g.6646  ORF Transcript_2041/g.6646 Transcript_2041/m.6646 type:complete len:94 (-) Transcript_2041:48-329(-)
MRVEVRLQSPHEGRATLLFINIVITAQHDVANLRVTFILWIKIFYFVGNNWFIGRFAWRPINVFLDRCSGRDGCGLRNKRGDFAFHTKRAKLV